MPACHLEPKDKKALIAAVGQQLVLTHGKRKYYKPAEVRRAAVSRGIPLDVHCWAYCIYTTPEDFSAIHEAAGEACDYIAMKSSVLADLATGDSFSLLDIDLSWIEWPDIDIASLLDGIDISW